MGTVKVRFIGGLQNTVSLQSIKLKIDNKMTLTKLIDEICQETGSIEFRKQVVNESLRRVDPNVIVLVDGVEANSLSGLDSKVDAGSSVVFLPISHGG